MGRALEKFGLLLWKNWLLQKRHPVQLAVEILVPVLLSGLLVLIRTLVDVTPYNEPTVYEPFSPYHFPLHNISLPPGIAYSDGQEHIVEHDNSTILFSEDTFVINWVKVDGDGVISDSEAAIICKRMTTPSSRTSSEDTYSWKENATDKKTWKNSIYASLFGAPKNRHIDRWFLLYSPKTPVTDELMKSVAADKFFVCGVANSDELQSVLTLPRSKLEPTTYVLAGIAFPDSMTDATDIPLDLNVAIRFPGERRITDSGSDQVSSSSQNPQVYNWYTGLLFPLFQVPGPRNVIENDGGSPGYYLEGFLGLQTALSQTLIDYYRQKDSSIPEIDVELQRFPYPPYLDDPLLQAMESFVPVMILLSFVYTSISLVRVITTEKEKQLKEAMKIMGLPNWLHWLAWFVKSFLLYFVSVVLITILLTTPAAGPDMYVLPKSDWSCVLAFLFVYIVASITFVFAISAFFSKANTAAIVTGLIFFLAYFPYVFLQMDYYNTSLATKLSSSLLSNTAMSYGFQIILMYEGTGAGLQWSNLWQPVTPGDTLTMGHIMGFLLIDAILYMMITIYVEGIYPGEFGVPLPWYFPFTKAYWLGEVVADDSAEDRPPPDNSKVAAEPEPRNRKAGVKIRGLRKVYGNGKVAVSGLTLNMYEGQITVLLGHNGAGKTTTMSMLTGLYTPTSGTALINDHDIRHDMDGVRETLGLCPQHNVLFDELSVKEHLDFFGKLKGLSGKKLEAETTRFIKLLELENKTNSPASSLSGGMQRKLSAGVALCGGSKVVLFDEPTSGMDPSARRALWDLLTAEKEGRTILLTTHFMDEADLLGDRIAIMSEGSLRCVGSSFFLKKKYGGGYQLIMVKEPQCRPEDVTKILQKYMPDIEPNANVGAELSFHLEDKYQHIFEDVFTELENAKKRVGIQSYGVSLTTMEEVFMKVGSDGEIGNEDGEENGVSTINLNNNKNGDPQQVNVTMGSAPLLSGSQLKINQVWAMFYKYMMCTYRSWLLYLIVIIIPVLDLTISILVGQSYQGTNDLPLRSFSIKDYLHGVATLASMPGADSKMVDSYKALIRKGDGLVKDLNEIGGDVNVSKYILDASIRDIGEVSQTYLLGTTFGPSKVNAMFNNQPYHVPPMALSYVYNAFLSTYVNSDARLNIINQPLPYTASTKILLSSIGGNMGFQIAFNMGFSFSFIAAFFIVFYVRERVSKAKHLQFVSGVNIPTFWITAYIWNIIISLGPLIAIIITLASFQEDGFKTAEELGTSFLVLLCAVLASLPVSYLASFLFDVPAAGFSRLVMINVFTGVAAFIVVMVLQTPTLELERTADILDWIFTFLPTYSLTTSFKNINQVNLLKGTCGGLFLLCDTFPNICCKDPAKCPDGDCVQWTDDIFDWEPPGIGRNIAIFFVDAFVLFFLLLVLDIGVLSFVRNKTSRKVGEAGSPPEDSDVRAESDKIVKITAGQRASYNLLIQNVSKYYGNFRAVNNLNLGIVRGECFGLLGVNGAGKTTTFKMLTGDEVISSGDAYVQALSIKNSIRQVHKLIGYCPQFDAVLDDLTGRETLRLFSLLRGVANDEVKELSEKLAKELLFYKHIDKKVKEYSGGNKRKLSTALALIGEPPVVYLDEPTTGMDPVAKRHLWDVICKVRDSGKTIILTSHSMEECEALCTRLAIMVNGEFKCLGSTQHLKDKFAEGYTLSIKVRRFGGDRQTQPSSPDSMGRPLSFRSNGSARPSSLQRLDSIPSENDTEPVKSFVETTFRGATLKEEYQGLLNYRIPRQELTWAQMFGIMQKAKEKMNIEDYSLGQTSLEQVFLSFTKFQDSRNAPE